MSHAVLLQDFEQLWDMPNPYAPSAQPRAGGSDGARKGGQDVSRLKQASGGCFVCQTKHGVEAPCCAGTVTQHGRAS